MYGLEFTITINPKAPDSKSQRERLKTLESSFLAPLKPLCVETRQSFEYYYPDDECELARINYICSRLTVLMVCNTLRQAALLTQIVLALTNLYDGEEAIRWDAHIEEPLPLDDEND